MIEKLWDNLCDTFRYFTEAPMLFNSGVFLFVFTGFLLLYALVYKERNLRTWYVVAFSLFFYYKSSGGYVIVLWTTIVIDFFLARAIHRTQDKTMKLLLLIYSLIASLGLLAYFKYTNFFIGNLNFLLGTDIPHWDIFLPIGISFYTFQSISYIVDVYRGEIPPAKRFIDYAFYMSFFPHLVAGPIVRAKFFLPQLEQDPVIDEAKVNDGLYFIIRGLIKKAIIADYIAKFNNMVFDNPSGFSGFENIFAIYGFTLQIFCDFSGYSDMAIGIAKLMGYDLGDNFNSPYRSTNITDFWRRWHISLSSWLRDYVYIPLGGNRLGKLMQQFNLFVTMLIGGFWHGASWNFVFWGGMHGAGLIVDKNIPPLQSHNRTLNLLLRFLAWFITFHFVAFLWIFFRSTSFHSSLIMLKQACTDLNWTLLPELFAGRRLWFELLILGYIAVFFGSRVKQPFYQLFGRMPLVLKALALLLTIQAIIQVKSEEVLPFIYFQF